MAAAEATATGDVEEGGPEERPCAPPSSWRGPGAGLCRYQVLARGRRPVRCQSSDVRTEGGSSKGLWKIEFKEQFIFGAKKKKKTLKSMHSFIFFQICLVHDVFENLLLIDIKSPFSSHCYCSEANNIDKKTEKKRGY